MPIFLLIIGMMVAEVYTFIQVWTHFGFINTVFALLFSAVLGAGIAKNQGKYVISELQAAVAQSKLPSNKVFHSLLIFLGGILLLIPGFVSDVFGLLLIIPGPRHLFVGIAKWQFKSKLFKGPMGIFTSMGGMGMGVKWSTRASQATRARDHATPETEWARDVTPRVIDVTPVSSESHSVDDNSNGGPGRRSR